MQNPTTSKQELREKIRAIVEKHTLPKVTARNKKDAKYAEIMGKLIAYELGLDDVVNSYVEDFEQLFIEAIESGKQEEREKLKSKLNPGLRELQYIGKAIGVWQETCEQLGLEVVWQDMGDDKQRPIKAISHSPLKAYHEIIESHRELDKKNNCRHEWKLVKKDIKISDSMELDPQMATEKVCVKCGFVD